MNSEFLFYSLDKGSVKRNIIHLLSLRWPQSTKELHRGLSSEFNVKITYQAVHKALKQLQQTGCLQWDGKRYFINKEWLSHVSETVNHIQQNYSKVSYTDPLLVIKNNTIQEKIVENKTNAAIRKFIPLLQKAFVRHNIFEKSEEEIFKYLSDVQKKDEIVLFAQNGTIMAGVVIIKVEDDNQKYSRWKLHHFACHKDLPEQSRLQFLAEIEKRIKQQSKKVKIEYNMAETETEYIALFEKATFTKEATFPDRYRLGETAYKYIKFLGR
ncbi:MAG: hypothetical protein AB1668_05985 [Nanoarchaeota archaeon]